LQIAPEFFHHVFCHTAHFIAAAAGNMGSQEAVWQMIEWVILFQRLREGDIQFFVFTVTAYGSGQ